MQTENSSIYGIDCAVHTTLPDIALAVQRVLRAAPDLIVFYSSGAPTPAFMEIVKDAYLAGCAVMLTANKLTAPGGANWVPKPAH